MAFQTGIIGFARVPGAADPNKVYALGKGGRAIADAADLMTATGASSVAEAWKLAKVQTFTPEKAYSFGIRGTGIYATNLRFCPMRNCRRGLPTLCNVTLSK